MTRTAKTLRRVPEKFISSKVDNELILIQGDSGAFFSLTEVGLAIWEMLDHPAVLTDISDRLVGEYEVDPAECRASVSKFADDLVRAGLAEFV